MPVPPSNPQDTQAAIAVVIAIAACVSVAYWRIALRVILFAVIALVIYGTVLGVHEVNTLMASHHR